MRTNYAVWIAVLVTPSLALAQPSGAPNPFGTSASQVGVRPADDSDLEMRDYVLMLERLGPCPKGPAEQCDDAREAYAKPGQRLTDYLIRQYEASVDEDYLGAPHYLVMIGKTRTDRAVDYLRSELANPREPRSRRCALHALVYVEDSRAIDEALKWVDDPGAAPRVRETAITAAQKNAELLGLSHPHLNQQLQAMERDPTQPYSVRYRAYRALDALEAKGLAPARTHPADLSRQ